MTLCLPRYHPSPINSRSHPSNLEIMHAVRESVVASVGQEKSS